MSLLCYVAAIVLYLFAQLAGTDTVVLGHAAVAGGLALQGR